MSEEYTGLCIGGPCAGETYTSTRGPTFEAHMPVTMPVTPVFDAKLISEPVTSKLCYQHVLKWTADDKHGRVQFGYWIPVEHLPVANWYIETELAKCYRNWAGVELP